MNSLEGRGNRGRPRRYIDDQKNLDEATHVIAKVGFYALLKRRCTLYLLLGVR